MMVSHYLINFLDLGCQNYPRTVKWLFENHIYILILYNDLKYNLIKTLLQKILLKNFKVLFEKPLA